jgi:hypothetical protein
MWKSIKQRVIDLIIMTFDRIHELTGGFATIDDAVFILNERDVLTIVKPGAKFSFKAEDRSQFDTFCGINAYRLTVSQNFTVRVLDRIDTTAGSDEIGTQVSAQMFTVIADLSPEELDDVFLYEQRVFETHEGLSLIVEILSSVWCTNKKPLIECLLVLQSYKAFDMRVGEDVVTVYLFLNPSSKRNAWCVHAGDVADESWLLDDQIFVKIIE